jgi:hypothetical protein
MKCLLAVIGSACFLLSGTVARADVTLLLEQPYGAFGGLTPTGHSAIYLSRVCAATPVSLRRCNAGEQGVVLSRYHRVGGYDWIAVPLMPYLYAIENADEVPTSATPEEVTSLRETYRRAHLESVIPDGRQANNPHGDWTQLVGESYDRTIYAFEAETTEAQDNELIRIFNSRPNHRRFNLLFNNCSDFAKRVINFYYPKAIHRSYGSDLGIMTPKQAAKCFVAYGNKHPGARLSIFVINQIPGASPQSGQVRGVLESFVKSKKYALALLPLAVLHPAVGAGMAYAWLKSPGFNPQKVAVAEGTPSELVADLGGDDRLPSEHTFTKE